MSEEEFMLAEIDFKDILESFIDYCVIFGVDPKSRILDCMVDTIPNFLEE